MLVVDASVALAWCFEDEATESTDAVLERVAREGAIVPDLWRFEVADVLITAERRARITAADATRLHALLASLPVAPESAPSATAVLAAVARDYALTAYDAAYLELAMRHGADLATRDAALLKAAAAAGVTVVGDG